MTRRSGKHQAWWGEGRGRRSGHRIVQQPHNRLLSRMCAIVAFRIFLLASLLNFGWPYKQVWTKFCNFWFTIPFCDKIFVICSMRETLCSENSGRSNKKWRVFTGPVSHSHILEGASLTLWSYLCCELRQKLFVEQTSVLFAADYKFIVYENGRDSRDMRLD